MSSLMHAITIRAPVGVAKHGEETFAGGRFPLGPATPSVVTASFYIKPPRLLLLSAATAPLPNGLVGRVDRSPSAQVDQDWPVGPSDPGHSFPEQIGALGASQHQPSVHKQPRAIAARLNGTRAACPGACLEAPPRPNGASTPCSDGGLADPSRAGTP